MRQLCTHLTISMSAPHGDDEQAGYLLTLEECQQRYREVEPGDHTNGDTLGVDGAQVGVFKQRDKVCLNRFL